MTEGRLTTVIDRRYRLHRRPAVDGYLYAPSGVR
jgi:hypothetical protein